MRTLSRRARVSTPAARVFSSASAPATSPPPTALDVAAFHARAELHGRASRASELAVLMSASAAVAREADSLGTVSRAMAHLLLTRESLTADDVGDPASAWSAGGDAPRDTDDAGVSSSAAAAEGGAAAAAAAAAVAREAFEGGGSGGGSSRAGGVAASGDASPHIGGALSFVPPGELIPRAGAPSNPVAVAYIDALISYLSTRVLGRLRALAASSPPPVAADLDESSSAVALSALLATPPGTEPPPPVAAWVASLSPRATAAFSARLRRARAGDDATLSARITAVSRVVDVLAAARDAKLPGTPAGELPRSRALHDALLAAVGGPAGVAGFTAAQSAAASMVGDVVSRARTAVDALNDAAERAASARDAFDATVGGDALVAARGSAFEGGAVDADALLSSAGLELPSLEIRESATGVVRSLAFAPAGGSHSVRLAAGHVPSMLLPLSRVLTPSEWAAALVHVRTALPTISPYLTLPIPVAATGAPALSSDRAATAALAAGPHAVSTADGTLLNATGASASTLNALAPAIARVTGADASDDAASQERRDALARAEAVRVAADGAPSAAARDEYLRYVLHARASRVLVASRVESETRAAAALDEAEADARKAGDDARVEGVLALRARLSYLIKEVHEGECVAGEEETLTALRRAELSLGPRAAGTVSVAAAARRAMRAIVGDTREGSGVRLFSQAAAASSPALVGSIAAFRLATPPANAGVLRVDWGGGVPRAAVTVADGGAARVASNVAAALGDAGGGGGGEGEGDAATSLGAEDCGGLADRERAFAAHDSLEDGVWPPVPRLLPWDLSWAARRARHRFSTSTDDGLSERNAAVLSMPPSLDARVVPASTGRGRKTDVALADGDFSVANAPALGTFNAAGAAEDGVRGAFAPPNFARAERLAAVEGALNAARADPDGEGNTVVGTARSFVAPPGYRAPEAHTLVHHRLLAAVDARDLGAAWALWVEYTRLSPQETAPDFLALEILMDAAARARRADLVFHVLWPRAMAWRMVPSPDMLFTLLKAAALDDDVDTALGLLDAFRKQALAPIEQRHFSAVVSACLRRARWTDAFSLFDVMRRSNLTPDAALWGAFFAALGAAGRAEDCHYVWAALVSTTVLAVPSTVYTTIIVTLAAQGNVEDMEAAVKRMARRRDGAQTPSPDAAAAIFRAYEKAGLVDKARAWFVCVDGAHKQKTENWRALSPATPPLLTPTQDHGVSRALCVEGRRCGAALAPRGFRGLAPVARRVHRGRAEGVPAPARGAPHERRARAA